MNKRIFSGLVILMGISILGIIAVQLVWMNNAIQVKNELFNRGVNEALHRTVSKLEDIHNFGVVNELIFKDSLTWVHENDFELEEEEEENLIFAPKPPSKYHFDTIKRAPQPVKVIRKFDSKGNKAIIELKIDSDSILSTGSYSYRINTENNTDEKHFLISDTNPDSNRIFVVRKDTIITSMDSLYTMSIIKIDSMLTSLDTFNFVRPDISRRLKVKARNLKRVANQAVSEISTWDVHHIDKNKIETVLREELFAKNIPLDFQYGIIRDRIMEFPMGIDSLQLAESEFQVDLYPNDIFQKNIKLTVVFPHRDSFIYRTLNWLLLASFLFSLFILITFALSIYYILRQKKISEMKSDFINNMTHEFKTPIATISVASDSIVNEKVVGNPEQVRYFAGMIKKENARMNRQVEDILTIARLDRKDFEFTWEVIDVHELIKDSIQGIQLQIEKRGGKIDAQLEASNAKITTDRMHCTNVVYNLIDNANKYSSDYPEIRITTKNLSKGVLISVEDKGIGMTKAVENKIFERFYRQTSGNIHNVKGFGLGLSYVKAVLEANQGTITVQSEPEKGSKFDVFLPFVRN